MTTNITPYTRPRTGGGYVPSPAATRAPAGLLSSGAASLSSARSPGRGELSLVSIHLSMVVHGIRLASPLSLTPTAVRLLGLQIGGKEAVPPPRMQRRLTREPHVTERMERIPSAQPPPLSKHQADLSDVQGMDFPMYVYKPRRGLKRGEENKETYKLPHRLIEKKRRDRINECIAQLKDLLPEHLKLTTLGHLEKAVVLELTLKHVKALTSLLEQQQQKILALQNGMQIEQPPVSQEKSEMFRSGFHMCAKEILQYLVNHEADGDFTPSHAINHIQKVAAEVLQSPIRPCTPVSPRPEEAPACHQHQPRKEMPASTPPKPSEGYGRNCVPVIQRAYAPTSSEQSGSDTDTDSGYGGELEKMESRVPQGRPDYYGQESQPKRSLSDRQSSAIKQEDDEPRHKRPRAESLEDELLSSGESLSPPRGYGSYSVSPNHPPPSHPLCMPFYLIPPSAAAYLPMLEKSWYPSTVPILYPGMGGSSSAMPKERPSPPQLMLSPRGGSPAPAMSQTPMDSPTLLQALKQVPPLNLETKD